MITARLWLQTDDGNMRKLPKPTKTARIVYQKNGDWYIIWYCDSERFRSKFNLNYIKDLTIRQVWADRICEYINSLLIQGKYIRDSEISSELVPAPQHDIGLPRLKPTQSTFQYNTVLGYILYYANLKKSEGKSKGYVKKLYSLRNLYRDFAVSLNKTDFSFKELDRDFAIRFKNFCIGRKHGSNTIEKNLTLLRTVLTDAENENDIEVNPKYKSKAFRYERVETDEVALNFDEIMKLYVYDFSPYDKNYELVRDNFILACLTGLRWGDWEISKDMIVTVKGHKMIQVLTEKTHTMVLIPLHSIALAILEKYDFNLRGLSNQKTNQYLKEMCQLTGYFNGIELLKKTESGKAIQLKVEKWREITAHTARRTFVTTALLVLNMPSVVVRSITGHTTDRQLFRYARINKEDAALLMQKAMESHLASF